VDEVVVVDRERGVRPGEAVADSDGRAVVLRDRGCIFPDCDRLPSACDIHHIVYFSRGGQTDLANAAMLCAFHHYLIHHSDWTIGHDAHGLPVVIPPAWIDPHRVPRRNTYWLRR